MTELREPLDDWLDRLASAAPAPGGGAAAALAGALGAALVSMVAHFTVGRPRYAEVEADAQMVLQTSEALRADLTALVAADAQAYQAVAEAYRRPRATASERAERAVAVQSALDTATEVPLRIAESARTTLALAARIAEIGNRTVLTDAGGAALLARAAQRAALLNVHANLAALGNAQRRAAFAERAAATEIDAEDLLAATLTLVHEATAK